MTRDWADDKAAQIEPQDTALRAAIAALVRQTSSLGWVDGMRDAADICRRYRSKIPHIGSVAQEIDQCATENGVER